MIVSRIGLVKSAFFVALLFSLEAAFAEETPFIDLSDVGNKKTVDRRVDLKPEAWRMVVFFARDTSVFDVSTGQAYVGLLTFRRDTKSFVTDSVFGLYPDKDQKFHLSRMPSRIDVRPLDAKPDSALLVWINPQQHAAIEDIAESFHSSNTYQLVLNECVSLMSQVPTAARLSKPSITLHP